MASVGIDFELGSFEWYLCGSPLLSRPGWKLF